MLYMLLEWMERVYHPPGFGMVRYLSFRSAAAAITALLIAFWLGPKIIRALRNHQIGEAAITEDRQRLAVWFDIEITANDAEVVGFGDPI